MTGDPGRVPPGRAPIAAKPPRADEAIWFRRLLGYMLSLYVRLVRATSRYVLVPPDMYSAFLPPLEPTIFTSWHANIFAVALALRPPMADVVGLTAPHPDGQIADACINGLGIRTISGTGANEKQSHGTGGVAAFRAMMRELKAGNSVYLTAEIPPTRGRPVSRGVITLARRSGRPIIAIAAASSRRTIVERLWDKLQVNHPFGRMVLIAAGPLVVDATMSDEAAQAKLKQLLDDNYALALRLADAAELPAAIRPIG